MHTHVNKTQDNRIQSVSNTISQKQTNGESIFQFVDNRTETVSQRKLQEMANCSLQVKRLESSQEMANDSQRSIQLKAFQNTAGKDYGVSHGISNIAPSHSEVIQLARWKLISQDSWIGIDPENKGVSKAHPSGTHPIGSIYEDTTGTVITPTQPGGTSLPSGSYGDWRKVARPDEQVDHFPPNAAYKGTKYANVPSSRRPAFPIRNREGHRPKKGEKYGYGGHVSSTNKTFVQKGWTPDLNAMMKTGNFFEAMKRELSDKSNVALMQYDDRSAFNELLKPAIQLARDNGWINELEHFTLLSMLEEYAKNPNG